MPEAKTIATGKCYACGRSLSVAEDVDDGTHMVLHTQPACVAYMDDDANAYLRKCKLLPADPIAEAMRDMLK